VGQLGRLIRQVRKADDERHLAERVGELEARRQREDGIDAPSEHQHLDLAAGHRARQRGHLGVRGDLAVRGVGAEAHGLADVAGRRVQEVDGDLGLRRVGTGDRHAAADRQPGLGVSEDLREVLDRRKADAGFLGSPLEVDLGDRLGEALVGRALVHHHPEDGEGEHRLRPRNVANPLVRVRRRQRLSGLDVDERAGASVAERVHPGERARVVDVRQPRLDEVGAERQHDFRVLERVMRDRVPIERDLVRGPDRLVAERLERHARARPQRLNPAVEQRAEVAGLELRHDGDRAALPGRTERADAFGDELLGRVPENRLGRAAGLAHARAGEPVGMVEALKRGLSAQAQRAFVDRMVRIALELHDTPLAVARDDAAAGRAFAAHRGVPRGDAGHDLVVGHHQGKNGLGGLLAPAAGRGRARRRHDLEEVTPVHLSIARGRVQPRVASDRHWWLRFSGPTEGGE